MLQDTAMLMFSMERKAVHSALHILSHLHPYSLITQYKAYQNTQHLICINMNLFTQLNIHHLIFLNILLQVFLTVQHFIYLLSQHLTHFNLTTYNHNYFNNHPNIYLHT